MKITRRRLLSLTPLLGAPALHAHGDAPRDKKPAPAALQKDWGMAGSPRAVTRTIPVAMLDSMRFDPSRIDIRLGETIRFDVRNRGKTRHEFVLGTSSENAAHAEMMMKHPDMHHDDPWMAHVEAGRKGVIVWTFNRPGEFEFACLIAGHYQAGMTGRIVVRAA